MTKRTEVLDEPSLRITKVAYSIAEVSTITSVGRTSLFAEIKAGRLVAKKQGRRTVIVADDLMTWLSELPRNVTLDGGEK